MLLTEKDLQVKNSIEQLIKEVWKNYEIKNAEFIYQLKKAKSEKLRASKHIKKFGPEDAKNIYIGTYIHYINNTELKKLILTLEGANKLNKYQLTAFFCFNDASLNWTTEELKNKILTFN